ncbi:MAG: hypothetical protein GOVbin1630_10 [Prokaryotic dsDNA virus sp.]|nr:MAG: hypothetical protein GOVbin1630_10 [Prokaryotic dsDNA virus sp.]|tara:strand:+ start:17719 stop:18834 length:1116 start_codon:yes stop_codon:yes gene_type:complete
MAITVANIEKEVSYFLGYGYNTSASGSAGTFLESIVTRAIRQFVLPSPIDGESSAHKWSWLTGTSALVLHEPVTFSQSAAAGFLLHTNISADNCPQVNSGVVRLGCDSSTVAGNFPSWAHTGNGGADQVGVIVQISGIGSGADGWHIPTGITNDGTTDFLIEIPDTSITIAEADVTNVASGVQSGVSFTFYNVMRAATTTFGAIDGPMYHDLSKGYNNLPMINIGAMRDLYAAKPIVSSVPEYVAYDDDKDRFLFYPPPDANYTLRYNYTKSSSLAGSELASLIPEKYEGVVMNAALALAENYAESQNDGRFLQIYTSQLKAAIMEDRANHRSEYFGVNRDNSDEIHNRGYRTDRADIYYTDRSGTKYPST